MPTIRAVRFIIPFILSLADRADTQGGTNEVELTECDSVLDCDGAKDEIGVPLADPICDRFGAGKEPNNGKYLRRGDGENGQSFGRCVERPSIPPVPEFGYFSRVLNRTYVNNFTKSNVTYERITSGARVCTPAERNVSACAPSAACRYEGEELICRCKEGWYGDPHAGCVRCPSGVGHDGGVTWTSTSKEGSLMKSDCRTSWVSHWDTITLSNEVVTFNLDQGGLRSSVFNDVSPKWHQVEGGQYGQSDPGSGQVDRRMLHECRDSAIAASNIDDLSSHCRHLIGTATGHGAEEGSGRVFRYTVDEFKVRVTVLASTKQNEQQTGGAEFVLLTGNMALSEFKIFGHGQDCGREDCGGTSAVYKYTSTQELPMPHHVLRNTNAFRADVKGPRGYIRPAHRPYSHSPARSRGTGGAPAQQPAAWNFVVTVTYHLAPGDEFVHKEVEVQQIPGVVMQVDETKAFHKLQGCQVLRPNDDCPSRSGTGMR